MGVLKIHQGGLAIQALGLINAIQNNPTTTVPFKNLSGANYNTVWGDTSSNQNFFGVQARATADLLDNYSVEDYAVNVVGSNSVGQTKTIINDTTNHIYGFSDVFNVTVTNNGNDAITVGCIRFYKSIKINYSVTSDVLLFSYYLDSPLAIAPGETQTIAVALKITNEEVKA